MCALIYTKAAEKTLILSPREGYQRAFDFQNWTEMRMAMFFSGISAVGDNAASVAETVTLATYSDRISFGIKNSDTLDLPGSAGADFIGISNQSGSGSECNGQNFFSNPPGALRGLGLKGVTQIGGGTPNQLSLTYPADPSPSTAYCAALIMRFVITNRGLATQAVEVSTASTDPVSGSDYSTAALRTEMNNAIFSSPSSVAWNDGSAAYDIPDAFYVRLPFYNSRLRISCMRMSRYA